MAKVNSAFEHAETRLFTGWVVMRGQVFTVSVAALEVSLLAFRAAIQRYWYPFMPAVALLIVNVSLSTPEKELLLFRSFQPEPVFSCH